MRSDRYYNQAEKFMPERWIRGRPEAKKLHPYAFIPFSHGVSRVIAPIEKILLSIVIAPLTIGIVVTLSCYKKT